MTEGDQRQARRHTSESRPACMPVATMKGSYPTRYSLCTSPLALLPGRGRAVSWMSRSRAPNNGDAPRREDGHGVTTRRRDQNPGRRKLQDGDFRHRTHTRCRESTVHHQLRCDLARLTPTCVPTWTRAGRCVVHRLAAETEHTVVCVRPCDERPARCRSSCSDDQRHPPSR
jgi:hypothetical protein